MIYDFSIESGGGSYQVRGIEIPQAGVPTLEAYTALIQKNSPGAVLRVVNVKDSPASAAAASLDVVDQNRQAVSGSLQSADSQANGGIIADASDQQPNLILWGVLILGVFMLLGSNKAR